MRAPTPAAIGLLLSSFVVLRPAARADDGEPVAPAVVVTARKAPVVKKLDKTVYNVADLPRAANGSAQDVLQSTPGLAVAADGRIAVKGNGQVTVLVDGKPTAMLSGSSEERAVALQTMSGADIASVEVITNPSAAYDANGGAIVNIVLKHNRKPGAHGQVQGSASSRGLWNAGGSGDLTRGGLSVHGKLAFRHDGAEKFRASQVDWNNPVSGQAGQTLQRSEVFVHRVVESAALGLDDDLSALDTISLSARYNARRSRPTFDVLDEERTDGADTLFHRISEGPNRQADDGASMSISHHDGGTALKATLQRSDTTALIDKSYRDDFLAPAQPSDYSHGATRSARHLTQATLDWTRASDRGQWGAGLDMQDRGDDLANYQATVEPGTGAETPEPLTTNGYGVRTRVSAAYLTDRVKEGKWDLLLGGRAEFMALRLDAARAGLPAEHWRAFDPSLHLKYGLGEDAGITLSYRRSLQMPAPRDLNPFTTYVDAQNLSRGNPGLQPQRLNAWEIGADADRDHASANLSAFYRSSSDTVTLARSFDDAVLVTSKQNGGRARSLGVTGSVDWTPTGALRLGMDGGVYEVALATPDLSGLVRQHGVAAYAGFRVSWRVGRDDVALDAHGQSREITPLGRYGATSSVNLSWTHPLDKTLSLTVNANDIFDGSKRSYATDTAAFRQSGYDHFVAQRVYVGLVKKFE